MMNLLYEIIKDNNLSVDKVVLVGGLAVSLYTGVEISKDVDFALVLDDYQKIQAMDEWGIKTINIINHRTEILNQYIESYFH